MCGADEVARPVRSPAGLLAPGRTLRAAPHPNRNVTHRTRERFSSGACRAPGGGRPVTELASTMTPREVAIQAAEAIRALNHLTYGGGELGSPDEVRDIIASLGLMGQGMPQLCEQLARFLVAQQEDG